MLFPEPKERRFRRTCDLGGFVFGAAMFYEFTKEYLPEIQTASRDQALFDIMWILAMCTVGGLLFGGIMRWCMRKWIRYVDRSKV